MIAASTMAPLNIVGIKKCQVFICPFVVVWLLYFPKKMVNSL
jgi:hypothetical protein